jgi:hypothetical protein
MGLSIIIMKQEIILIEKKDFLKMVEPHHHNEFKKMRIKDLRHHFKLTLKINNNFIDMTGKCFKCLKPLRADYTQYENWCLEC